MLVNDVDRHTSTKIGCSSRLPERVRRYNSPRTVIGSDTRNDDMTSLYSDDFNKRKFYRNLLRIAKRRKYVHELPRVCFDRSLRVDDTIRRAIDFEMQTYGRTRILRLCNELDYKRQYSVSIFSLMSRLRLVFLLLVSDMSLPFEPAANICIRSLECPLDVATVRLQLVRYYNARNTDAVVLQRLTNASQQNTTLRRFTPNSQSEK